MVCIVVSCAEAVEVDNLRQHFWVAVVFDKLGNVINRRQNTRANLAEVSTPIRV
jgi:hypothetical protein